MRSNAKDAAAGKLEIGASGRCFVVDGRPFLYAADTAWSAPTNATLDEWRSYLRQRSSQGFTAIQMNILPQWDRGKRAGDRPFGLAEPPFEERGGVPDYGRPNEDYFSRVDSFVREIRAEGLIPALVVFWADYAPDNWCSRRNPGREIPRSAMPGAAAFLATRYSGFDPVYIVSGDTDFAAENCAEFYREALAACKRSAPAALTCLHVCGDYSALPPSIVDSPELDFYMYQSGHTADQGHLKRLAAAYRAMKRRPVVNGEPCYEGMGKIGRRERFDARDVRRARWLSMLSGANAGFGYGSYGVWNWHRAGDDCAWLDVFGPSPTCQEGLARPGAAEVGLDAALWRGLGMFDLEPEPREPDETDGVACARGSGGRTWFAYSDGPRRIRSPRVSPGTRAYAYDFEARSVACPRVEEAGGGSVVDLRQARGDCLVVLETERN